ncbi:MFS general substrate transporter [Aaosphaeria arxii CBS 175.79]|uniref:MFS general substrate transporter n=1 Tax=Aaosphaeria arxii CBS 175.79 TaxID=1450172 RepID=A0A6A5XAU1_9PLEO|nr:MFS general substrate transporter [Aaosphaeria arxii CBS 175.79]KAF2010030.1 MFS general substrate transporter [Aaosphaeria arxii CBS 175.79]
MISLSFISFMVSLDSTILVTVLPTIAGALHGTSIDAFWAGTSYLLTSAVFQPVIASISEVFGRQQLLLFSLVFFTVGTIMCGAANDFTVLLAGRSIKGIGGGGIITMNQVIFCDIVPLRLRPKYFAIVLSSWSLGTLVGPMLGGALAENTSWRWVFWINLPFCGVGIILAVFFIRLNAVAKMTFAQKLKHTDFLGAFLFVGGLTSILIGLSWAGIQYSWTSVQTLCPVIVGFAGLVGFVVWQKMAASHPLLPLSLFYCPSAFAAFYCAFVNGLVIFMGLYYFPFYSMSARGVSAIKSGVDLLPALVLFLPGSIIVATLTTRLGRFRWALWVGWAIMTLGSGLWILLDEDVKTAVWAVALAVFGVGAGMVLTSVNVAIQAIAHVEDAAMAASMYGFFRSLGMPIGVILAGTIFQNVMSTRLETLNLPTAIAHDSERYVHVLQAMDPADPKRALIIDAYVTGFRGIWIFMVGMTATGLLASVFIKKFDMNKELKGKFSVGPSKEAPADNV